MSTDAFASFDLTGKVALVTGGSRGLGQSMVRGFAAAGADVLIVGRKIEASEELAKEIQDTYGRQAIPLAANVGHWDALQALTDEAYERLGKVDVLVNNAGMSLLYDEVANVTEAMYDKVMDVNLKGPFRLTALVGTRMAASGGGSIVNITSMGAVRPRADILPYAAAKAGLNALTIGFSRTFGPNVRVNAIMAGTFLTDVSKAWDMEKFNERAKAFSLQRGGQPDEIVGTALYLASDASSFTTGAVIPVDGGQP